MHTATLDELLRAAAALVPALKERATRCEQLRRIPPETVRDLVSARLIRIGNPRRYGGHGLDLDAAFEVVWELGRGCAATAWCYSLWTVHNWWLGYFPERAQEDFFASGPDTLFSSGLNPAGGTATPVADGCRVSGRWSFSSGCDVVDWVMVATPGPEVNGLRWHLLPRADCEIVDTWFASGMRGSGSKDLVVREALVPAHRTLDPNRAGDGDWTGWQLHRRPSYRLPLRAWTGWDLAAPLVGIAQGAVDEFTVGVGQSSTPGRTADSVALQLRLAEASAEVDAARAVHRSGVRAMLEMAGRGETPTELARAGYRRDKAFVTKLCVQAVNRLFEASGAHAILESAPIQRFHRDVHAAAHHAALGWDVAAEQYGRLALGAGAPAPDLGSAP